MTKYSKEEMQKMNFKPVNNSEYEEQAWRPEEAGDNIIGEYTERKENCGFEAYTFYIINDGEQKWSILENKVLQSQFEKVEPGDIIKITYLGKKQIQNGNRFYKNFSIEKADID